jgi:hypothetical protein
MLANITAFFSWLADRIQGRAELELEVIALGKGLRSSALKIKAEIRFNWTKLQVAFNVEKV